MQARDGLLTFCEAREYPDQIAALRTIKNDLTGHELRKLSYIQKGLIPAIHEKLRQTLPPTGPDTTELLRDDHQLQDRFYIEAANVICVLAHGGPTYVQPILNSNILHRFSHRLASTPPPKLLLPILRCLNAVADNLPLSSPHEWTTDQRLPQLLYSSQVIGCFSQIIRQANENTISQQACDSILALLCKTCHQDRYRTALVDTGVLSALCERLAGFVVSQGLVLSHHDAVGVYHVDADTLPKAAPQGTHLSPVLESISLLVEHSRSKAECFLSDPFILAVLPTPADDFSPSDIRKTPWGGNYLTGAAVPRARTQNALESLLPSLPNTDKVHAADRSSFPPLGSALLMPKRRSSSIRGSSDHPVLLTSEDVGEDFDESMVVPWLLYVMRTSYRKRRVLAAKLLVILHDLGLVSTTRTRTFVTLLVPVLVQMLGQSPEPFPVGSNDLLLSTGMRYTEAIPAVIAKLICDCEPLQRAAFHAKAIPKLTVLLKATFIDREDGTTSLWQPEKGIVNTTDGPDDASLGTGGPSQQDRHTMAFREGLLRALAAIAPFNDLYRKEICDQGAVAQIMLSLEPFQGAVVSRNTGDSVNISGNSAATLLAACGAVRALTRSATALRTKLVDADVAKAIIRLMNNPEPMVRVAATKVISNLALDFSPMKQSVSESALVKKLCEQAHSANAKLRYESIFALKTLVNNSPNQLRREVIDELGTNWIRHLVATDPYDIPPGEVIGLVERDYPRGTFARLNDDIVAGDVVMEDNPDRSLTSITNTRDEDNGDRDYNKHTVADDITIQEQILALLRNLTCGENASEIVEYILKEIGQDEFVRILLDRLRPRSLTGTTRKGNQISTVPRDTIIHTLCIIAHIAAADPKLRTIIAGHNALMKQIASFCNHTDKVIRSTICWIVMNLLYEDDGSQIQALRHRAVDLHRLGLQSHMRRLESGDPDLDVKERAKAAAHMFGRWLGP